MFLFSKTDCINKITIENFQNIQSCQMSQILRNPWQGHGNYNLHSD
jgi:hypothetical protein